jgi:hypothetical protein
MLQGGYDQDAYDFLKMFHGHYRERNITKVYAAMAWNSYKVRLRRKFRHIPFIKKLFS